MAIVLGQATVLKHSLLAEAKLRGGLFVRPPVIHITPMDWIESLEERYRRAQVNCRRRYAIATLDTHLGQLEIEGNVPKTAVLDTGTGAIILGKSFAAKLLKCLDVLLELSHTFVTSSGAEKLGVRKTTMLLSFTLAKGTTAQTIVKHVAWVSNTDIYDVLLGMSFLGSTFGYVDPLAEEFY